MAKMWNTGSVFDLSLVAMIAPSRCVDVADSRNMHLIEPQHVMRVLYYLTLGIHVIVTHY